MLLAIQNVWNRTEQFFSICKSCDQIDEISDKKLYKYLSEVRDMNGLKLSGYNLELFGTCKTCDQKQLQNMKQ